MGRLSAIFSIATLPKKITRPGNTSPPQAQRQPTGAASARAILDWILQSNQTWRTEKTKQDGHVASLVLRQVSNEGSDYSK